MYRKGSIVLVPFPFTDFSGSKVRPALILAVPKGGVNVLLAFISSKKASRLIEGDYEITLASKEFSTTGLKVDSIVRLSTIASLDRAVILGPIGMIGLNSQLGIDRLLKKLLNL